MFDKLFCAHRGLSALMPENTLPAFSAAHALGADEIELDVRLTKDGQIAVTHDKNLERISDGTGLIAEHTMDELRKMNIGIKHGWEISFCSAEEVFALLANRLTFNIHIKEVGEDGCLIRQLTDLVEKYNAADHVYYAANPRECSGFDHIIRIAPQIERCAIQLPSDTENICDMALRLGCRRIQFWRGLYDQALIDRLHSEGIRCNLFNADSIEGFESAFGMGIDTILTNRMDLAAVYRRARMN